MDVSRRDLLKTAGVGALGVAALGALSGCAASGGNSAAATGSSNNGLEVKYDVDVLVVGGGLGGYCAGLRALEKGLAADRVLVVEKMSGSGMDYGGSSMVCSGNFLIAKEDTAAGHEAFADALWDVTGRVANFDLLKLVAENSNNTLNWMIEHGANYGEMKDYSAYDACAQRTMDTPSGVASMREAYEGLGGESIFDTSVIQLLNDSSGVSGAIACDKNGYYKIAAKKTILCTGGILGNADLMETYIGEDAGSIISRAPWSITGDGVTLAKGVGASMAKHGHGVKAIYLTCTSGDNIQAGHATRVLQYCIAVNSKAQRYADESIAGATQDHVRALLHQPGCTMGMLADSTALEDLQAGIDAYTGWNIPTYTFDTIDEVAELFGCDADALKATVDDYNAHVVADHTAGLAIDKTSKARTITEPPFYAFYPFHLTTSYAGTGVMVDTETRILRADNSIVPNLYAAGELVGGCSVNEFFGGLNQAKAATFGYLAAEHAVDSL